MARAELNLEVIAGLTDKNKVKSTSSRSSSSWNFNAPMYADFEKISKLDSVFDDDTVDESYFCVDHESALYDSCKPSVIRAPEHQNQEQPLKSSTNHKPPTESSHRDRSVKFLGSGSAADEASPNYWTTSSEEEVRKRYIKINKKNTKKAVLEADVARRMRLQNLLSNPTTSSPRDLDIIANVPQEIQNAEQGDTDDRMEYYFEENDMNDAFKDTEGRSTPERRKKAGLGGAEGLERGRNRVVDNVTSMKKRLSMSVDRGNTKLNGMRNALSRMNIQDGVREGSVECLRNGSTNESGSFELNSSSGRQSARRKILGGMENLSAVKERDGGDGERISKFDVFPLPPASVSSADPWLNWVDHEEEFVSTVTSNNEAAMSDVIAARPAARVPHTGVPFFAFGGIKLTMIEPFSFEARNRRIAEQKERKLQQYYLQEKKAREFRAAPFPEIIYAEHTVKRREGGEDDAAVSSKGSVAVNRKASFKAKPPTVLMKAPFIPRKSDRAPTEILKSFEDSAARRAEKRADVEATRRERLNRLEEECVEKERIKKEREETERKKERAKTVHRAQPIGYSR